MNNNHNDVNSYMEKLIGVEREWMESFINHMRKEHPELEEVISYQIPTYKLGTGKLRNYIAFSPAKKHFSMHSMDFEYMALLKEKLAKPGKGKGCVNIPYSNIEEREIVIMAIEEIVKRHELR